MSFWNKLLSSKEKTTSARMKGDFIAFLVKCDKCGEEISVRINRRPDVQSLYLDPGDEGAAYALRKEILGKKCQYLINMEIDFDRNYRIIAQNISGGRFITSEEK